MLTEVRAAKPFDGRLKHRWFTDEGFDLTVWNEPSGEFFGFQLSYDKIGRETESTLTWRSAGGFELTRTDDSRGRGSATPVLREGGRPPDAKLLAQFDRHAAALEADLRGRVLTHLTEAVSQFSKDKRRSSL